MTDTSSINGFNFGGLGGKIVQVLVEDSHKFLFQNISTVWVTYFCPAHSS